MYRNTRPSHTVQPVISQLLLGRSEPTLFTITHHGEPSFFLLPWSLYAALRSLLGEYGYKDPQLIGTQMVGISSMARRFLSFQNLEDTFLTESGACDIVFVLKWNKPVGAVIRFTYYVQLIAFLQEHQAPGLEPFLIEEPDAAMSMQDRLLSLSELRNLAMQLPHRFAQERHWKGGNLPFLVTNMREPVLVVLSWELWETLVQLLVADKGYSNEQAELVEALLLQLQAVKKDHIFSSPPPQS